MTQDISKRVEISKRIEIPKRLQIPLEYNTVIALCSLMEQLLFIFKIFKTQYISQGLREKENEKKFKTKLQNYIYNFWGGGRAVQKNICVLKKLKSRNNDSKSQKESKP